MAAIFSTKLNAKPCFHDSHSRQHVPPALFLPSAHHHSIPVLDAAARRHASSFGVAPGPPKLPAKEQAEFERLQREAAVSSAFQSEPATAASEPTTQAAAAADTELNEGGGLYRVPGPSSRATRTRHRRGRRVRTSRCVGAARAAGATTAR
ncbi:hypothetical protein MY1884_001978 [Beauveria asiatica]